MDSTHQRNSIANDLDKSLAVGCTAITFKKLAKKGKRKLQKNTCQSLSGKGVGATLSNKVYPWQPEESDKENRMHSYYKQCDGDNSLADDEWMIVKIRLEKEPGLGFCIKGRSPVIVSSVKPGGQASRIGLYVADALYAINGRKVYQYTTTQVASVIRSCKSRVVLEVRRPRRIIEGCSFSTIPQTKAALPRNQSSNPSQQPSVVQSTVNASSKQRVSLANTNVIRCERNDIKKPKYAAMRDEYMQETYGVKGTSVQIRRQYEKKYGLHRVARTYDSMHRTLAQPTKNEHGTTGENIELEQKQFVFSSPESSQSQDSACLTSSHCTGVASTSKHCSPVSNGFVSNDRSYTMMTHSDMGATHSELTHVTKIGKSSIDCDESVKDNLMLSDSKTPYSLQYRSAPSMLEAYLVDSCRQARQNQNSFYLSPQNYTANTVSRFDTAHENRSLTNQTGSPLVKESVCINGMCVLDYSDHGISDNEHSYASNNCCEEDCCEITSEAGEYTSIPSPEVVRKSWSKSAVGEHFMDEENIMERSDIKSSSILAHSIQKNEVSLIYEDQSLQLSCVSEFLELLEELPSSTKDRILNSEELTKSSVQDQRDGNQRIVDQSANDIVSCEEKYVQFMLRCVHKFSRPLQFNNVLTPEQFDFLFQNIERLTSISHFLLTQLQASSERKIDSDTIVDIYKAMLPLLSTCFSTYLVGLPNALRLLNELETNASWTSFLQNRNDETHQSSDCFSIESFLWMPLSHATELFLIFRAIKGHEVVGTTVSESEQYSDLSLVLNTLEDMVEHIQDTEYDTLCDKRK